MSESAYTMQTMTLEPKDYQRRHRARIQEAGGKQVAVMLSPQETAALETLKQKLGITARDAIGKALLEAAKRIR